jgi:hypothetical protein
MVKVPAFPKMVVYVPYVALRFRRVALIFVPQIRRRHDSSSVEAF